MSIRGKHWKNTSCSLGINIAKIQFTSVVNYKREMENYDITQKRCSCFLLTCVVCYIIILLCIYVLCLYANNHCRFYF